MPDLPQLVASCDTIPELISGLHRFCEESSFNRLQAEGAVRGDPVDVQDMRDRWQQWVESAFPQPRHLSTLEIEAGQASLEAAFTEMDNSTNAKAFLVAMTGLMALDDHFGGLERLFREQLNSPLQPDDVLPVQSNLLVGRYLLAKQQEDVDETSDAHQQFGGLSTRANSGDHAYPGILKNFVVVREEWAQTFELEFVDSSQLRSRLSQYDSLEEGGDFVMATATVLPRAAWTEDEDEPSDLDIRLEPETFRVDGYTSQREAAAVDEIREAVRDLDGQGVHFLVLPELTVFQPAIDAIRNFLEEEAKNLRLVLAGSRHVSDGDDRVNRTCLLYGLNEFGEVDELTGTEVVEARHEKFGRFQIPTKQVEEIRRVPATLRFIQLPVGVLMPLICADVLASSDMLDQIKKMGATIYGIPSMTPTSSGFENQFGNLSHAHQPIILWANCCGVTQSAGEDFQRRTTQNGIRMPVEETSERWKPTGCWEGACALCSQKACARIVRLHPDGTFDRERWP